MLQLLDRLGFDLPDTLPCHPEDPPHLFERVGVAIGEAVSQPDDLPLTVGESLQQRLEPVLEQSVRGGVRGAHGARIFHEFAEAGVFAFAHGPVKAHRLPAHVEDPAGFLDSHASCLRDLLRRRLAAEFVKKFLRGGPQLREHVDHVHRDTDRAGLVGDRPGDRLTDPPGRVGRELEATTVFILVHRPHQSRVALLDQIQKAQAAVAVFLGDRHDQSQVGR